MKTLDYVIKNYKSNCCDERDLYRLGDFIPEESLNEIGLELRDEHVGKHKALEWTRENILAQLEDDVSFGFEKALNQRGISASLMFSVVAMWNWILEEGLESFDEFPMYGMPLFIATAKKYSFPIPEEVQ